jgi:hypothetical protein
MDLLKSLYPVTPPRDPWSPHTAETLDEECHGLVLQVEKKKASQLGPALFRDCEEIMKWKGQGC